MQNKRFQKYVSSTLKNLKVLKIEKSLSDRFLLWFLFMKFYWVFQHWNQKVKFIEVFCDCTLWRISSIFFDVIRCLYNDSFDCICTFWEKITKLFLFSCLHIHWNDEHIETFRQKTCCISHSCDDYTKFVTCAIIRFVRIMIFVER